MALPSSYRATARFNRRQQSPRFLPTGDRRPQLSRYAPTGASEKPSGDRWLCRRAIVQQHDSIGDNSRRDFCQQEIDASRRRDMLQQEHLKCQQAKSQQARATRIEPNGLNGVLLRNSAIRMHHQVHSTRTVWSPETLKV